MLITSNMPSPGYPPNAVGANTMTKEIAQNYYDSQRPRLLEVAEERNNPSKPSYTWPLIGLAVSAIATAVVCRLPKIRP